MDIREDLPSNYDQEEQLKKKKSIEQKKPTSTNQLPESVIRAREMMKEADEKINKKKQLEQDEENKALFDLLRELEEEEEEQEEEVLVPVQSKFVPKEENEDNDEYDDDEEDDRYDTEISDNMFDRFGDDEQYPLDGTVDQEDFTCYDEIPQVPSATITEIVEENERSTPKLITKRKSKPDPIVDPITEPMTEQKPEEPKKMSKFKLAQLEKKNTVATTVTENPITKQPIDESKPKKFSKFKLLRQQQQDQPREKINVPIETKQETTKQVVQDIKQPEIEQPQQELTESFENMMIEPKKKLNVPVKDNGIPQVISKPKKMSKFKLARQVSHQQQQVPAEEQKPLKQEPIKPKRSVTWDTNNSVRDHDNTLAPSVVSETTSYSQPMKKEETKISLIQQIKSASDIYRTIQNTQNSIVDDYPSLDDNEEESSDKKVDLNELIKVARQSSEAFWKPTDGTESLIPIVKQSDNNNNEDEKGIIVAKKSKLDNKIMKGAVMERDITPIDLDEVEEDMDMREITSNYQQMRLNMLASTGGFSFATKPEFEVFDEELPLPSTKKEEEEEEEEIAPKKMSRFKAARLGMKPQNDDDDEYQYA